MIMRWCRRERYKDFEAFLDACEEEGGGCLQ